MRKPNFLASIMSKLKENIFILRENLEKVSLGGQVLGEIHTLGGQEILLLFIQHVYTHCLNLSDKCFTIQSDICIVQMPQYLHII